MNTVHEAKFYEKLSDERVRCTLCPHDCVIADGGRGACGVRYNDRGSLYTLVYDKVVAREVNPIEKKPFYHFHPASYAYSIKSRSSSAPSERRFRGTSLRFTRPIG
jgi:pyruvate formate lyase activating enzyme